MRINQSVGRQPALLAGLAVALCAACTQAGPIPPDGVLRVAGTLTDEGIECPALRGDDGQLYTLAGDLSDVLVGDAVCVEGKLAEISICQQGITLGIEKITRGACTE